MTTTFATFCIVALSLVHFANTLDCPSKVYGEFMKDVIIDCKISGVGNVYWYKGNSTKTSPIVKLQDGKMYTFQGHGHYDIDENGSLVIVDLEEDYFGVYSVVHFYSAAKSETDQIKLDIAIKPRLSCPSISGCFNCSDDCTLLGKAADILMCSISGALPAVDIKILVNPGSGIRVLRNASHKTFDPVTGTWNTTSVMAYEWHDCHLPAQIACDTRDFQAFEISDRIVTIQSDVCTNTTKNSTTSHQAQLNITALAIAVGVFSVFLVIVILVTLAMCLPLRACKQHPKERRKQNTEQSRSQQDEIKRRNEAVNRLVEGLVYEYAYRFSDPLPKGQSVSTDAFFTGIYFIPSSDNDHNQDMSSGPNLIQNFFQQINRDVLVVDDEFLTKALLYYASSRLVRYNTEQEITFILDLEGLNRKQSLVGAIVSKLKLDSKITTDEVKDILENCRCLIVVKGVEGLNADQEEIGKSNGCYKEEGLTIEDLLKNLQCLSNFKKLRCLVLAKTGGDWKNVISNLYIRSDIGKFITQNRNEYVSDIFKYYNKPSASGDKTPPEDDEENFKNEAAYLTKYVCDRNNIVEKIGLTQSMFILFFHNVVSDIRQKKISLSEFCLYRRSYLIKTILSCFEFQYSQTSDHTVTFNDLQMMLGRAGLPQGRKDDPFTKASTLTSEFSAKKIQDEELGISLKVGLRTGFLKCLNEHDVTSEKCFVTLCDEAIQEYIAALAIKSKDLLDNFLKSICWSENERMRQVLQLMYGTSSNDCRSLIVKKLMNEKRWDILIDCLFESEDEQDFEKIIAKDRTIDGMKISELDRHSHRLAVYRLCRILATNKVRLRKLSFKGYWSRDWFMQLEIHKVEKLDFIQMDFSHQTEYNYALKFRNKHNVTQHNFRFQECQLPGSQKLHSESTYHDPDPPVPTCVPAPVPLEDKSKQAKREIVLDTQPEI